MKRMEWTVWCVALAWAVLAVWPASFWYDTGTMRVIDATQGEPIRLNYVGGPQRDFKGSYSVIIRKSATNQIVLEDRSAIFPYMMDAARPEPLFLEWWAPGIYRRARALPPGEYSLETCWTIHSVFFGIVPAKVDCHDPEPFEIRPA